MIQGAIREVVERKNLSTEVASQVMREMMAGLATQSQMGAFLTAMRMKGETEEEIRGFVTAMRDSSSKIVGPPGAIDMCGTGGDSADTFNISTVASFVVAGAGVAVAKHGNRSVSSKCGSADLLAALGIPHDLPPAMVQESMSSCGMGFMFAPVFHQSMRNVIGPRKEVGLRTFFNLIGPMTNPAGVKNQLVGVYDPALAPLVARVLNQLGSQRVLVVHGSGTDECSTTGTTQVVDLRDGEISRYSIEPGMFGMETCELSSIRGGGPAENARIALSVLKGERSPRSDVVALNAGAGLYVSGSAASIHEGVEMARSAISSGRALERAREFAMLSWELERRRQSSETAAALSSRLLHPEVLRARAGDISRQLMSEVLKSSDGRDMLQALDRSILANPSVLSIIFLRRIKALSDSRMEIASSASSQKRKLSESVRASQGLAIIAEYKSRSPSSGPLSVPPDPVAVADAYAANGVAGVSVVVEPEFFSGSLQLFSAIRSRVELPMLFKDFVVSARQIEIADQAGADAVLLITRALRREVLESLAEKCLSLGMEPLVEVHDEQDIRKLRELTCYDDIPFVGVNSRDLRTLETDLSTLRGMREKIDSGGLFVAESGVSVAADLASIPGYDAALVGSAFMRADDLPAKVRELVKAGRSVAR